MKVVATLAVPISLALAGTAVLAGCGGNRASEGAAGGAIDVMAGSYEGVGIGSDRKTMEAVFGENEPAKSGPASPIGSGDTYRGPVTFRFNPDEADPYTPVREPTFRYEDASFFLLDGRIAGVMVTADRAKTEGGVAIGDDLDRAREEYDLRCGTALEGTEYEPYAACTGKVAPERFVWFGGNPIQNITVGTRPLGGV